LSRNSDIICHFGVRIGIRLAPKDFTIIVQYVDTNELILFAPNPATPAQALARRMQV
jgi:hypothetical protein